MRLGMITGKSQTAMERVAVFSSSLPGSADAAWTIVEAYSKERFGQQSIDEDAVIGAWRSLAEGSGWRCCGSQPIGGVKRNRRWIGLITGKIAPRERGFFMEMRMMHGISRPPFYGSLEMPFS